MRNLYAVFLVLAIFSWCSIVSANQQFQYSPQEEVDREESWSDFLPIWGKQARAQGYDIPKPFGISFGRAGLDLPLDVVKTRVSFGEDATITRLPEGKVRMGDIKGTNLNIRADFWLFPFLNFYGFIGETYGDVNVGFDLPADLVSQIAAGLGADPVLQAFVDRFLQIGEDGFSLDRRFEFAGTTRGLGVTMAGGYKDFFAVADFNASKSELDLLADSVFSKVWTYRFGWNGHLHDREVRAWVGFMTHDVAQTVKVDLSGLNLPVLNDVKINLDVDDDKGKTPLAGFSVELAENWTFMTDVRFGERKMLNTLLEYRF